MSKKIKCQLSEQGINNLINKLKELNKNVVVVKDKVIKDLIEVGEKEISNNISSSEYTNSEPSEVFSTKDKVGMKGRQAIYDEFGTGTIGANNPHPKKDEAKGVSLNPYNSGKRIRTNTGSAKGIPVGELYWTYKYNGQIIYTQGRPAGQQVYKASKTIRNNIKEICKKRVGEAISKL